MNGKISKDFHFHTKNRLFIFILLPFLKIYKLCLYFLFMEYHFSYLIGDLSLLFVWLILFLYRKDTRKEMIWISLIFGFAGLFSELIYTIDWWGPMTITGTLIGIEDFLFGFAIGGISSIIYEIIFNKKHSKKEFNFKNKKLYLIIGILIILFFGLFYLFNINSFYSTIIAFIVAIIYMWIKRPDLIKNSLASGFLLIIISSIGFIIPELITPGWVESVWYFTNIPKKIIFFVPLEDIIWFFLAGSFIGPLYEFWKNKKLN